MVVSKCVRCGDSSGVSFLIVLIVIMSLLVELEALAFFIILLMSQIVGKGNVNLVFFFGIRYCSICSGVILLFVVNLDLILWILLIKLLLAILVISLSLVITLLLHLINLGNYCLSELVISLTFCHIFLSV